MLALRRFHNKLVQGTADSLKSGNPTIYELREYKPVLLEIQREISGHLLLGTGQARLLPLPHNYDKDTERLYLEFRVQGIAAFSTITGNSASNILIRGTRDQQGRYAFSDFITSVSVFNPTATDIQVSYTCFVIPDLDDADNYFGLVDPLVPPTDSGGQGQMATNCCARVYSDSARLVYTGTPVTTGAWTTLVGTTSKSITALYVFDSSGQTMEIGVGPNGSESRIMIIQPGGPDGAVEIVITQGSRIAVRAVSATADVGEIVLNTFS